MGLFGNKKNGKNSADDFAKKFDRKEIRYFTRRDPDGETILGRAGCINIIDGELVILCNNLQVLRKKLTDVSFGELLSLEGVVITCGQETFVAYYKYYR